MKKLLIIGKNSFIAKNIYLYLKKFFKINKVDYSKFKKLKKKELETFDYLINCSLSKKYVDYKYSELNDIDFKIAKKIYKTPLKMIFLSSRKVYKPGNNLKETSILKPKCLYSKNKLITERKLSELLNKKILILRVANLIGKINTNKSSRKIHNTFIDNFFLNIKKNKIFNNKNFYKDFITVKKFSEIIRKLLNANAHGIFNVSIGEKIFLKDLVKWLNYSNKSTNIDLVEIPNSFNSECFYLNNSKLKNKIKIKFSKLELKNFCIDLSKIFFK